MDPQDGPGEAAGADQRWTEEANGRFEGAGHPMGEGTPVEEHGREHAAEPAGGRREAAARARQGQNDGGAGRSNEGNGPQGSKLGDDPPDGDLDPLGMGFGE